MFFQRLVFVIWTWFIVIYSSTNPDADRTVNNRRYASSRVDKWYAEVYL